MSRRGLLIAACFSVLMAAGAGVAWLMWSHSPTYSLRETVAAVRERDRYKFERYVDVDRLIQSFVSDYASDNPLAMAMAGALSTNIREQVAKAIEDGTTNGDSQLGDGVNALVSGTADLRLERQGPNAYFQSSRRLVSLRS